MKITKAVRQHVHRKIIGSKYDVDTIVIHRNGDVTAKYNLDVFQPAEKEFRNSRWLVGDIREILRVPEDDHLALVEAPHQRVAVANCM